jgi:hypothetical protein
VVGDTKFWCKRKNGFRERNKAQYRSLSAHWDSITNTYWLRGPSEGKQAFKFLARMAVRGLPARQGGEPWERWVDELRREKLNCSAVTTHASYSQSLLENRPQSLGGPAPVDEGVVRTGIIENDEFTAWLRLKGIELGDTYTQKDFEGELVTIERVFEASAMWCEELESRAEASAARSAADRAGGTHGPRRGKRLVLRSGIEAVKKDIREMRAAGLPQVEICKRLGDKARPENARWRSFTWPAAFKNPEYRQSVKSWISRIR